MTTENCKCDWTDVGSVALKVPVMVRRDPTCLNHGDGSEWWQRTQEHARRLGGHTGSSQREADRG